MSFLFCLGFFWTFFFIKYKKNSLSPVVVHKIFQRSNKAVVLSNFFPYKIQNYSIITLKYAIDTVLHIIIAFKLLAGTLWNTPPARKCRQTKFCVCVGMCNFQWIAMRAYTMVHPDDDDSSICWNWFSSSNIQKALLRRLISIQVDDLV